MFILSRDFESLIAKDVVEVLLGLGMPLLRENLRGYQSCRFNNGRAGLLCLLGEQSTAPGTLT